ncbi:hypothetical protein FGO68_gene8554 [Halteria grandinella]|uniref:Uncharacterized protein n=1 Tax=Halteria grandinella TaxID=5974 RepID=A0A8J8T8R0_HALGN|nr:hypothetical protein FGO68_gene8554 [Halteria grandinella]
MQYIMFCDVYDTGTPARATHYTIPVDVQLYSGEGSSNLLVLAPYISNFTEYGQVTIQMGYEFIQGLKESDIPNLLDISITLPPNPTQRSYTWYCESLLSTSFVLRLKFTEVLDLTEKDRVKIRFKDIEKFYIDSNNNTGQVRVRLSKTFKIDMYLPKQLQIEENQNIQQASQQASIGLKSVMYANFGINLIMAASLQLLWGMINSLQLVVRTPLMGMKFPSHTKAFFSSFVMLTNFDILPSQELNEVVFGFESVEYEDNFTDLGYDSLNTVDNIGSFLYYLILIFSMIFLAQVVKIISTEFSIIKQSH